jgi:anti-anti-sigma factor
MSEVSDQSGRPLSHFAEVFVRNGAVVLRFTFKTIFDPLEIDQLQTEMERLVRETRAACFILDMSRVEFISSGFLGLIITASTTLKTLGAKVRLCSVAPGILRVIKTTHLDKVLDLREDLDAATADLK